MKKLCFIFLANLVFMTLYGCNTNSHQTNVNERLPFCKKWGEAANEYITQQDADIMKATQDLANLPYDSKENKEKRDAQFYFLLRGGEQLLLQKINSQATDEIEREQRLYMAKTLYAMKKNYPIGLPFFDPEIIASNAKARAQGQWTPPDTDPLSLDPVAEENAVIDDCMKHTDWIPPTQ